MRNELQNRKREQALLKSEHDAPSERATLAQVMASPMMEEALLSDSFARVHISRIEVKVDDPDKFAMALVGAFKAA
jgi:hypothetical protein